MSYARPLPLLLFQCTLFTLMRLQPPMMDTPLGKDPSHPAHALKPHLEPPLCMDSLFSLMTPSWMFLLCRGHPHLLGFSTQCSAAHTGRHPLNHLYCTPQTEQSPLHWHSPHYTWALTLAQVSTPTATSLSLPQPHVDNLLSLLNTSHQATSCMDIPPHPTLARQPSSMYVLITFFGFQISF